MFEDPTTTPPPPPHPQSLRLNCQSKTSFTFTGLIRIKFSFLAPLSCPFTAPQIRLCYVHSRNLIHKHQSMFLDMLLITQTSMLSFTSATSETPVENARSSKWEHSACYGTMDGSPPCGSCCLFVKFYCWNSMPRTLQQLRCITHYLMLFCGREGMLWHNPGTF